MNRKLFLFAKIIGTLCLTGIFNIYVLFDKQFPNIPVHVWLTNFVIMPIIAFIVIHISTRKL